MKRKIVIGGIAVAAMLSMCVTAMAAEWTKTLPAKAVTVKVGDMVWATIPKADGEMADVGVYKVDAVAGNTATLADKLGTKYPNIPGAVITPLGSSAKLKVGDIAIGHAWGASKVIGKVSKLEAGQVTLKYEWAKNITEKMMEHAEPVIVGIAPMAWVAYDNNGTMYKGLVIAVSPDKVWISTDSGHVLIQEKAKIRPLTFAKAFKANDVVKAYTWGFGYQPGTVVKELDPGLMYEVKLAGKPAGEKYYFANLATKI